ncbi:ABC transporter ATP-binding protein [Peribacillus psychrosaccharolyticus]|uniref:ABC transporter ATP-binding protein n=1 Tax=Peribacillus psychrosaccharolyticus TaxID=1407 RepID=A0A974NM66_PERPY|nr:ABC transporter ATP-binding protein [Peribacillus psychrosaccharolyticus]MEC2056435.1 ABC transporter ATP-binding protein [Peribacillus psychrosaccharolyticus]MED3745429.1 ABC transporter ATP-binding protein [Peribacillus psychrosaccharolyticus]QQT00409.1 ABC transporter ATP-binding protein [Peribacillus psychrosaccharolyticus]
MLSVEQVSRTFNHKQAGLIDVSFSVEEGEIIGILGTSGCGKSTLLRVLSGLDKEYTGKFSLEKEDVGMMFQEPRLMPWLTVEQNVAFGLKGDQKAIVHELLDTVGLSGFEKHYPKDLSGGMSQRTAIARALVTEPEVLLLDEPFSAVDAFTKMQLQELLLSIWKKKNTTMLLVTHDIDEALYLCDRILILKGQPGVLAEVLTIKQSKPRDRTDPDLASIKAEILHVLDLRETAS